MHMAFSEHRLVRDLSPEGLGAIYALGETLTILPDQVLIESDAANRSLFVLLEGAFRVGVPQRPDRIGRGTLGHRGPGDLLGEYSFIDAGKPSARVSASTKGLVLRIPHDSLRDLLENDAAIGAIVYRNLLHYLVNRLRSQDDELDCLML